MHPCESETAPNQAPCSGSGLFGPSDRLVTRQTFPGCYDSLDDIRRFAARSAESAGLSAEETYAVQLAVDEASANIIDHAYGGECQGDIECICTVEPDALTIELRDRGQPFDPTDVAEPDLECPLDDRQTGGLGLVLMRKLMDAVRFEFGDEGNTLTLVKRRGRNRS